MATHPVSTTGLTASDRRSLLTRVVSSGVIAGGLVVDAVVHLRLAADRDGIGGTLSEGNLFRVEAALALGAAVLVMVLPRRRLAYLVALAVAGSALGAVVLYRYVNVGALGPLPNMYEPIWYGEKTLSAVAEAVAMLTAAVGLAATVRRRRHR